MIIKRQLTIRSMMFITTLVAILAAILKPTMVWAFTSESITDRWWRITQVLAPFVCWLVPVGITVACRHRTTIAVVCMLTYIAVVAPWAIWSSSFEVRGYWSWYDKFFIQVGLAIFSPLNHLPWDIDFLPSVYRSICAMFIMGLLFISLGLVFSLTCQPRPESPR